MSVKEFIKLDHWMWANDPELSAQITFCREVGSRMKGKG